MVKLHGLYGHDCTSHIGNPMNQDRSSCLLSKGHWFTIYIWVRCTGVLTQMSGGIAVHQLKLSHDRVPGFWLIVRLRGIILRQSWFKQSSGWLFQYEVRVVHDVDDLGVPAWLECGNPIYFCFCFSDGTYEWRVKLNDEVRVSCRELIE